MKRRSILLSVLALAAGLACCSSDPEGPITEVFIEEGTYGVEAGETERYVEALAGTTITLPLGVGTSPLLEIGESRGIMYETFLLEFDFTPAPGNEGKIISSAELRLPIFVTPEGSEIDTVYYPFNLYATFNELLEGFTEEDTIVSVPPHDPVPIPDSLGSGERVLNEFSVDFDLERSIVQGWIDGTRPHYGVAVIWIRDPDSLGLIELNARERGTDPSVIRVRYTDSMGDTFPVVQDYSVATFSGAGLNAIGGLARRVYFPFTLDGFPDSAMIQRASLVLTVNGEEGLGATTGEVLLGASNDFFYYLYTPDSADPTDSGFFEGTGVDLGSYDPAVTETRRFDLKLFIDDVAAAVRRNTGLVFQSDLENARIQRSSFFTSAADSSLRPYLEVIYSLPAEYKE